MKAIETLQHVCCRVSSPVLLNTKESPLATEPTYPMAHAKRQTLNVGTQTSTPHRRTLSFQEHGDANDRSTLLLCRQSRVLPSTHGVALLIRPAAPSLDLAPTSYAPRRTTTKERHQKRAPKPLANAELKHAVKVVQPLHSL